MSRNPESRGTCAFCGESFFKRSIHKHLAACSKRAESIQAAEASQRPVETLWHLRIQDAFYKAFWLDLEMKGSATLSSLDKYLRAIWLECCGHLSEFTIGGWGGETIGMNRKANSVFRSGLVLRHLYDFGTTSETDISVVEARTGKPTSTHPITLMARNDIPAVTCQECGQLAKWLCLECVTLLQKVVV